MFTNSQIGARIHDVRVQRGLTLGEIATSVGVAESTIQRYEKGTISKFKLPVIESIAKVLSVNPNWLIGNVEDPDPVNVPASTLILTPAEARLVGDYRELNAEGQEKVTDYAADLVASGRYQKMSIASVG